MGHMCMQLFCNGCSVKVAVQKIAEYTKKYITLPMLLPTVQTK